MSYMTEYEDWGGPFFERGLVDANGKLTRLHKGGGAPPPPPPPAPPPTERRTEVQAASRQAKVDSSKRKGQAATLLAGETGGVNDESQRKTLLGGG